ncbi:class I SAM-dependent methyltransferase [Paenibacillus sp. SI8]|uniref:class I SAM-dependent methyltransferase n=1 Tax=unclassified Paenibacillus TaxID=185978 RepID=UPI00346527A7
MDTQVKQILKKSYDQQAEQRDRSEVELWKVSEMDRFLSRLRTGDQGKKILDLGSGPGHQAAYLQKNGCDVTCIDLSEEMVRICQGKGLEAFAMDFFQLELEPVSYDAIWTMNALLHVPKTSLNQVLVQIDRVLKPEGFIYLGIYGGYESEGIWEEDSYRPQRFFAFYENEHLLRIVSEMFEVEQFDLLPMAGMTVDYQAIIARKKQLSP